MKFYNILFIIIFQSFVSIFGEDTLDEVTLFNNDNYNIIRKGCDCESGYSVVIKRKTDSNICIVENGTSGITDIFEHSTKLVISGIIDSNSSVITIIDNISFEVVDYFICYSPIVSSTKRYIASIRFFSRFADVLHRSNLYLIYDLEKSPEENRFKTRTYPKYLIGGKPFFPLENFYNQSYEAFAPSKSHLHVNSYFRWMKNADILLFVDYFRSVRSIYLLDLTKEPAIFSYNIDFIKILSMKNISVNKDELLVMKKEFHPCEISLNDSSNKLTVKTFNKISYKGPSTIEINLNDYIFKKHLNF